MSGEREWIHPLPNTLEVDRMMWNSLRWDGIDLMIENAKQHKEREEKKARAEGESLNYEAMHKSLLEATMADLLEFKDKLHDIESTFKKEDEDEAKK